MPVAVRENRQRFAVSNPLEMVLRRWPACGEHAYVVAEYVARLADSDQLEAMCEFLQQDQLAAVTEARLAVGDGTEENASV